MYQRYVTIPQFMQVTDETFSRLQGDLEKVMQNLLGALWQNSAHMKNNSTSYAGIRKKIIK